MRLPWADQVQRDASGGSIPKRLLVLSVYPEDQAGTRLRAYQYQPYLQQAGLQVDYWSFLSLRDSRRWFAGAGRLRRVLVLTRSVLRTARLPLALRRAEVVLVLREALPVASLLVERAAARRAPVIWDVDDAVWTEYPRLFMTWLPERLRRSPDKYARLAGLATQVWAGSDLLAHWCRPRAADVHVVPTVIDVAGVTPSDGADRTVVWVGSPSTAEFLEAVLPFLQEVEPPVTVHCVGATGIRTSGVTVHQQRWSAEAEREVLARARVGLYPIDVDHPLGPAKAGLKAILYMAHGVPSVVTPTPSVAEIVRDGVEALHAEDGGQWRESVCRLLEDDQLWCSLAEAGRHRAQAEYSLEVWGPRVAGRLAQLAGH